MGVWREQVQVREEILKKPKRRPSDKERLDFLENKVALITIGSSGHYGVYPVGPNNDAQHGNTLREALDAAMKAEKRGPLTGHGANG